jgi:hypothetical protein
MLVCIQAPRTHLAFVVIIRNLRFVFLISVICDQRAEPPTDWFIIQTARLLWPNDIPPRHTCYLGMVAPIRGEQQVSWGYWRMILLATSVVLAWLPQSDVSDRSHEDTEEWYSSPRLFFQHSCPNQTWETGLTGSYYAAMDEQCPKSHYVLV